MSINFKEKVQDFLDLLFTILVDSLLVLIVGLITYAVKWVVEKCYEQPLNQIDNVALFYVYSISKYLLISSVFLFAVLDILLQIKKILKRVNHD